MRQIGAWVLGVWYMMVVSISLQEAIKDLSTSGSTVAEEHYLLLSTAKLGALFVGATLAGLASRTHPLGMPILVSLVGPGMVSFALFTQGAAGLDYELPPLVWGWRPSALGLAFVVALLYLVVGYFAGVFAAQLVNHRSESACPDRGGAVSRDPTRVLGVHWGHWLWLWLPGLWWAVAFLDSVYLAWLSIAFAWHFLFHPSLWLNWKWWLSLPIRCSMTFAAANVLLIGIGHAWENLALGRERGMGSWAVAGRFVGYGVGVAVFGCAIIVVVELWVLSLLPIVAETGRPWWVIF